jgi:hypothetical protein
MSIANTVPWPEFPPYVAVPYKVVPDRNKPPGGFTPSLLAPLGPLVAVKLCRTVNVWPVARFIPQKTRTPTSKSGRKRFFLDFTGLKTKRHAGPSGDAVYVGQNLRRFKSDALSTTIYFFEPQGD